MAYCDQTDVLKQIPEGELAELSADSGSTPDAAVVSDAISKADAEIDSYLGVKYQVPVSPTPPRVQSLSVDIALFYLYSRRSVAPELREQNYKRAVMFLRSVADGKAVILDSSGAELASAGSGNVLMSSSEAIFDRENMRVF